MRKCKKCGRPLKKKEGTVCLSCVKSAVRAMRPDATLFKRKAGRHTDRKKQANKMACRKPERE